MTKTTNPVVGDRDLVHNPTTQIVIIYPTIERTCSKCGLIENYGDDWSGSDGIRTRSMSTDADGLTRTNPYVTGLPRQM